MTVDQQNNRCDIAVIDLGSNSFRLETGHLENGLFASDRYIKEPVRLAAGFDENGNLSEESVERACCALRTFAVALEGIPRARIRSVATEALRTANNSSSALARMEQALGLPIRILSGKEEATLVFRGCVSTLPPSSETRLVIDIGGASTELAVGRGLYPQASVSFPVGCVNITKKYFSDGTLDAENMQRATRDLRPVFESRLADFDKRQWDNAYGSAGTIGAIHCIASAEGWGRHGINEEILARSLRSFAEAGHISRLRLKGLRADRKDILAGGLVILSGLFQTYHISLLKIAHGSLRTGMIAEMAGPRE